MQVLKGNYQTIVDLLTQARNQLIVGLPNISIELARILAEKSKEGISTIAYLDIREEMYREGFGDIKAIEILKEGNVQIMNTQGSNVTFFLIDDKGYFYFPKSRYFEAEGSNFDLISMSYEQTQLLGSFFSDTNNPLPEHIANDILDSNFYSFKQEIRPLDDQTAIEIREKLKINPPLKPILKRQLNTYISFFKFVELKFPGSKLHVAKITLPKRALPFNDAELQRAIEANLRLFTNIPEKDFFKPFFALTQEVEELRFDYLFYIKCRQKNIIRTIDIVQFKSKVESIKEKLLSIEEDLLNELQKEINQTRERIVNNLIDFLMNNPPNFVQGISKDVMADMLRVHSSNLIKNIFPHAKTLLEKLDLECLFYDITWDDLNNEEVLREMMGHELIDDFEAAKITKLAIEAMDEESQ